MASNEIAYVHRKDTVYKHKFEFSEGGTEVAVVICDDKQGVEKELIEGLMEDYRAAIEEKGGFALAVSGGSMVAMLDKLTE